MFYCTQPIEIICLVKITLWTVVGVNTNLSWYLFMSCLLNCISMYNFIIHFLISVPIQYHLYIQFGSEFPHQVKCLEVISRFITVTWNELKPNSLRWMNSDHSRFYFAKKLFGFSDACMQMHKILLLPFVGC